MCELDAGTCLWDVAARAAGSDEHMKQEFRNSVKKKKKAVAAPSSGVNIKGVSKTTALYYFNFTILQQFYNVSEPLLVCRILY